MWRVRIGRDGLRGEIPGPRFPGLKSDLRRGYERNVNIRIMYIMLNNVSCCEDSIAPLTASTTDICSQLSEQAMYFVCTWQVVRKNLSIAAAS